MVCWANVWRNNVRRTVLVRGANEAEQISGFFGLGQWPMIHLRSSVFIGLIFGIVALHLAVVGLLPMLNQRWIIVGALSLGHGTLLAIGLGAGAFTARNQVQRLATVLRAGLAGAIAAVPLAALVTVMLHVNLRWMFIALSPDLLHMLTFGLAASPGLALVIIGGGFLGMAGCLLSWIPMRLQHALIWGCAAVVIAGVFQELIQIMLQGNDWTISIQDILYTWEGLTPQGAVILSLGGVVAGGGFELLRARTARPGDESPQAMRRRRTINMAILLAVLIVFPLVAGSYVGQVMMLVGLYILMGMGLNLEVGLAGLLDLGFVAFFAVGAYTTAILTADSPHALASYTALPSLTIWEAMPISVLMAVIVGVAFGIPVLGVRGDYLAVATMGLGEIVRVLVASDFAAPLLGGAQGILQIPRPALGNMVLNDPVQLFYVTLVAAMIAAWFAWRLENSRLGRAWMALRDDEDVAQALGINLVKVKLLAYGLGAAFAGLAGSIFATMLGTIYPSSFQLQISINVLALIIVGGMGSLPGVVVGAAVLIGLPELLREFGEYRYLFYGAALVIMMRVRPEGLWPSPTRRRELHADDAVPEAAGESIAIVAD
jgi:branched-chain amino acid transport system permease protein